MHNKACIYWVSLLILIWGCESETVDPQDTRLGYNYFPLSVGNYAVYSVEYIQYHFSKQPDTSRYHLKEVVADYFPGEGGEIIYRLERYSRGMEHDLWQLDSVWTARKNTNRVVVVENNVPLIKLVFPFKAGLKWDGNALNSKPEQIYTLELHHEKIREEVYSPLVSLLANSLTVMQQQSQDTVILYTQKSETYVEDVGLFYKKSVNLQYCASEPECIGLGIIEAGWHYKQTLIDYGNDSQ